MSTYLVTREDNGDAMVSIERDNLKAAESLAEIWVGENREFVKVWQLVSRYSRKVTILKEDCLPPRGIALEETE